MSPPENEKYNPSRPPSYDLNNLPIRTEGHYWESINRLSDASSKQQRAKITKETGISRLPLCAASPAFIHPTFFPVDPFHLFYLETGPSNTNLFYENCMAFIWDTWTSTSKPTERIHLTEDKARRFGEAVAAAWKTLPPAFCGPVRDPFLKRHSQYKIYEWMALLHWYTLPIGMELGFDAGVLENFSHFVSAIEFAMSIQSRSEEELAQLHSVIRKFLASFEALYIAGNPEHISRSRLCIFQLIHVPMHIKWNGSIRVGSQATVERSIGEVGRKIRSKKSPFANLANIITEKELLRILKLYYPSLSVESTSNTEEGSEVEADQPQRPRLIQKIMLTRKDSANTSVMGELESVERYSHLDLDDPDSSITVERWGKARLTNGRLLRSRASDQDSSAARFYRWTIFGEALAFYEQKIDNDVTKRLVVYHQLVNVKQPLGQVRGQWDRDTIHAVEISAIVDIVGIWEPGNESKNVYVLRKHPAIALLSREELGKGSEADETEGLGTENAGGDSENA
ncbi:hypothetical protein M413DRAFT_66195 [Hebeloma cylindrosporum]|uniref:Uncharacterized protein n=1 Tax=Hebeloma cylindrosporum TaxID=76867 RepID=A0A0C3CA83_HEBCY|nr:hypothetical protein M413DRAFT_66195 [Hebeloma cylindrosporum h7]